VTAHGGPLWTNRHTFGTPATQTCAQAVASVSAEGGGTTIPTLMGGGTRFSREHLDARRPGLGTVAQ
jgi:hypothetical protein